MITDYKFLNNKVKLQACWSRYRTSHFHLFICVAIISVYGKDIITQKLPHDEMLLYFASLANHMDAKIVLKKVRNIYRFFSVENIN